MATLVQFTEALERCEADVRRLLGDGPALRIAEWRRYADNEAALLVFVRQRVQRHKSFVRELRAGGGFTLEQIIAELFPDRFATHEVYEAQRTLQKYPLPS